MKTSVVRFGVLTVAMAFLGLLGYAMADAIHPGQACFSLPSGDSRRSAQCKTPASGCNKAASCTGTCWEGEHGYTVLSCNNYVESYERKCYPGYEAFTCKDENPTVCISWTGYWVYDNCTGNNCSVSVLGSNCSSVW